MFVRLSRVHDSGILEYVPECVVFTFHLDAESEQYCCGLDRVDFLIVRWACGVEGFLVDLW